MKLRETGGPAKLVLILIELLRRLLEKQALRLEEKMVELRVHFGLTEEDLTLSLGPLGNLM